MSPRAGRLAPVLCATLGAALAGPARAAPPEDIGEARSLLRDIDVPRAHVAGESDATAVVANPAGMGFLRGLNAVIAGSMTDASARRRGSGLGVFLALPIPFRLLGQTLGQSFLSLGAGYQMLCPGGCFREQTHDEVAGQTGLQASDQRYHKLTLAAAVPLMRWAPGLSLGLSYARLWSAANVYADGLHQFDLALAYRPSAYVALGLVGRALNAPKAGFDPALGPANMGASYIPYRAQPYELDAEIAVRPIRGAPYLEVGAGVRVAPSAGSNHPRFALPMLSPRGRISGGGKAWRVFVEGERYWYYSPPPTPMHGPNGEGFRFMAGLELDFRHVGVAGAVMPGGSSRDGFRTQGGAFKLRVSAERYPTLATLPREGLRVDLDKYRGDRGTARLVEELDRWSQRRAPVVALEVDSTGHGWGELEEIREALLRVRGRGGKVVVYLRGGGLKDYFLAVAADRVVLHPTTRLSIVGMRAEVFYFADLLARLGAKAEFVRAHEYKSRPEQFERTGPTPESDAQRRLVLTDLWNHVVRMIARDRKQSVDRVVAWINAAPHTADDARALGLVDELAYADELDARVSDWLDRPVNLEAPTRRAAHDASFGPGPAIAVVHVEGTIAEGESLEIPIVGSKVVGGRTIVKAIDALREDPRVRAVVVRIDSPGGSVAASDDMARALDRVARRKPVVISMGDLAASGGYYVATAGQYIFADATTRTGSIGVFRPKVDASGVLAKFGVSVDTIEYGKRSGMYSWFKPYSEEERAATQAGVDASYAAFLSRVARARKMTLEEVDALARGRVWSGVRAQELGLVDAYGGLREAVIKARALAGMSPGEGEVRHVPAPPGLADQISALFGLKLPSPLGLGETAVVWVLQRLPPSLWLAERPQDLALAEEAVIIE